MQSSSLRLYIPLYVEANSRSFEVHDREYDTVEVSINERVIENPSKGLKIVTKKDGKGFSETFICISENYRVNEELKKLGVEGANYKYTPLVSIITESTLQELGFSIETANRVKTFFSS